MAFFVVPVQPFFVVPVQPWLKQDVGALRHARAASPHAEGFSRSAHVSVVSRVCEARQPESAASWMPESFGPES